MMQTEFKALMHCGMYVDADRLDKGIYTCAKPFVYEKGDSIDAMIERVKWMKDLTGAVFVTDEYINNLKQCEMVEISITIVKP